DQVLRLAQAGLGLRGGLADLGHLAPFAPPIKRLPGEQEAHLDQILRQQLDVLYGGVAHSEAEVRDVFGLFDAAARIRWFDLKLRREDLGPLEERLFARRSEVRFVAGQFRRRADAVFGPDVAAQQVVELFPLVLYLVAQGHRLVNDLLDARLDLQTIGLQGD